MSNDEKSHAPKFLTTALKWNQRTAEPSEDVTGGPIRKMTRVTERVLQARARGLGGSDGNSTARENVDDTHAAGDALYDSLKGVAWLLNQLVQLYTPPQGDDNFSIWHLPILHEVPGTLII